MKYSGEKAKNSEEVNKSQQTTIPPWKIAAKFWTNFSPESKISTLPRLPNYRNVKTAFE